MCKPHGGSESFNNCTAMLHVGKKFAYCQLLLNSPGVSFRGHWMHQCFRVSTSDHDPDQWVSTKNYTTGCARPQCKRVVILEGKCSGECIAFLVSWSEHTMTVSAQAFLADLQLAPSNHKDLKEVSGIEEDCEWR